MFLAGVDHCDRMLSAGIKFKARRRELWIFLERDGLEVHGVLKCY
jgi:hypothetical protein